MAKTNTRPPTVTRTTTFEGGSAFKVGVADELLLTAASTYLGEKTFYESADKRLTRLVDLMHQVAKAQPGTAAGIVHDLRSLYKIRTTALVLAVEYLRAGGPMARQVIDKVVQRPDEPAEILAYWLSRYGKEPRRIPWALRRGLADAVVRQYTERNVLKYGRSRNPLVSMADVIELVHPKPKSPWQAALFRYMLDEAHHGDGIAKLVASNQELPVGKAMEWDSNPLPLIYTSHQLGQTPEGARRNKLRSVGPEGLADAGYTWERLSAWLPGGMDAEAWGAVIPNMGVMALLRNLRNFDQVGISPEAQATVEQKITDATEVAESRIFPYRVWTAYVNAPSDRWKHPLGVTLELAAGNVASLDRTLFLIDVSGSMVEGLSDRSEMKRYQLATIMGVVAYRRATRSTLALFAANSTPVSFVKGAATMGVVTDLIDSVERHVDGWQRYRGSLKYDPLVGLGQGTNLYTAIVKNFDATAHDRVVVFTDDQTFDNARLAAHVPQIVTFNLGGFEPQSDWGKGRIHVAGFSDATFQVIADLTAARG